MPRSLTPAEMNRLQRKYGASTSFLVLGKHALLVKLRRKAKSKGVFVTCKLAAGDELWACRN
jgi:hypothetical protein